VPDLITSSIAIVEKVLRVEPKTPDNALVNSSPQKWTWRNVGDTICEKLKFTRKERDGQQPITRVPRYWTGSSRYKLSREQPLGIVTMEDVLRALLRSSIFDEKDISHYRRRRGNEEDSPREVLESELQRPFSREPLNNEGLEVERELPAGLDIQLAPKNGEGSADSAARGKHNSGNTHLSFSKPPVPLSSKQRRANALTYPLGGTPRRNSPETLFPKDKGKGKASEVSTAMSENNYSTNASDDLELESLTGASVPSSIFSHSTGTTSHLMDLLGLKGQCGNSSGSGLSTLDEANSASAHSA